MQNHATTQILANEGKLVRKFSPLLALTLLMTSAPCICLDATYKWIDENGNEHISNRPPKGNYRIETGETNKDDYSEAARDIKLLIRYKSYDLMNMDDNELKEHSDKVKRACDSIQYSEQIPESQKDKILNEVLSHMDTIRSELYRRKREIQRKIELEERLLRIKQGQ